MKFRRYIAGAAAIITLAGCSESQLDYRNAQVNNGLIYSGSDNRPFSGLVTNVPENFIRSGGGYNDILLNLNQILRKLNSEKNTYIGRTFICDAQVEKGYISGAASCYQSRSRALRYTAEYKNGNMNGDLNIFAADGKTPLAKAYFSDGQVNGAIKIWSPNTGKLVYLRETKNGKLDGALENYDETTAQVTYKSAAKDGLIIGKAETFTPEGKIITQIPYDDGVPHGPAYEWNTDSGQMIKLTTYDHGARTGESKEWSPEGALISHKIFERGGIVEDKLPPMQASTQLATTNTDKCVESLIDKFHQVNGDDTPIKADQIAEWESSCGGGSRDPWME